MKAISRKTSRLATVGALAGTAVLAVSVPAFAHVTVQAEGTPAKGGYTVVDFKVPNERDNASTTKIEVNFPTDHPLSSVAPQPVDGWKIQITKSKLATPIKVHGKEISEAVTKVTWTADGKGVEPGYFQKFPVSIGQLPQDADQLVFKALQTYSNKEVVRWIEVPQKGQAEPDNPAPVLQLAAAADSEAPASAAQKATDASAPVAQNTMTTAMNHMSSSDTTARVLGIVGIVVGIAGLAYGVFASRRRTTA
ncbi:YcnI family protein [Streptomyces sp. NPDC006393]|uniref:YcnI family copper-binding membrane protein n=1 Tax=Streptomyces sp. NPDC006393 TaxID=3156763 RepID=UPI0033EC918B